MTRWARQILSIEQKGYAAFLDGKTPTANPYTDGYMNQNGKGGSVQRQRREAWRRGWNLARRENVVE
jgi:hypothetical protein